MTAVLVVVAATTTLATGSAFAESDEENQGASGVNICGNGSEPDNAFCQDLISQIQGDLNDVYISGEQEGSSDDSEDSQDPTEEAEEDAEFADSEFE